MEISMEFFVFPVIMDCIFIRHRFVVTIDDMRVCVRTIVLNVIVKMDTSLVYSNNTKTPTYNNEAKIRATNLTNSIYCMVLI